MTISDPIGDMLTRIRNAQMKQHPTVVIPALNLKNFFWTLCNVKDLYLVMKL